MEKRIKIDSQAEARALLGKHDENIRSIEDELGISMVLRGTNLKIKGPDKEVRQASRIVEELLLTIRGGGTIKRHAVAYSIKAIKKNKKSNLHDIYLDKIEVSSKRQVVNPKSKGQKEYIEAIKQHDIVFGIGPAGTGKTYLAAAMAVNALNKKLISRIILTRPALEAGENLGFLPGDLYAKITPYLRPLYDALYDMVEVDRIQDYIQRGIIEIAPLAYMRGRTLNDSFIILDEAQNSTPEQMKMFLTRLGFDSKTVITGDITQSDLPQGRESGLVQVESLLKDIKEIKFAYMTGEDVVRHDLVQEIIKAYEKLSKPKKGNNKTDKG